MSIEITLGTRWNAFFPICNSNYRRRGPREITVESTKERIAFHRVPPASFHEREGGLCLTSLLVLAAFMVVPDVPNGVASAMTIANNAIVNTTRRDARIQSEATPSTTRRLGGSFDVRTWKPTRYARPAQLTGSWWQQRSWITSFPSSTVVHRSIRTTCKRCAGRATRRNPRSKEVPGESGRATRDSDGWLTLGVGGI